MSYLLDTCVVSELVARQPHASVIQWLNTVEESRLFLSVLTIGEIQRGIAKLPDSRRKEELSDWLLYALLPRFRGRLLALDEHVMLVWGQLTAQTEMVGRKLPAIDSLLAATALFHHLALVTRNESDFRDTGITIINPWVNK